jgi:soluble lytic murein transglycosylase
MQAQVRILAALSLACAALATLPTAAQQAPNTQQAPKKKAPEKSAVKGAVVAPPAKVGAPKPDESKQKTDAPQAAPSSPALTLSTEERQHSARFDAAIAKVRDHSLSAEDGARIRDAVKAITETELPRGKTLRDAISDQAGRKLVDWFLYRGGYGTAGEIRAFMVANPAWPDRERLTQRAEEALFKSTASPREVKAFFADIAPVTGVGLAALAAALAADSDQATAKALAAKAWVEFDIPAVQEAAFLKKVGPLLSEADHKRRLDALLLSPNRWPSERSERAAAIRRVIALLPEPEKKKAEARLAVFLKSKNSNQLLNKLPPLALKTEWGLAIQKAQALRRQNKNEEAWKILLSEREPTLQVVPDGWWQERRAAAYAALKAGKPKTAYDLVRNHGQLSINAHNSALFMSGWIALRHLQDAKSALGHFEAFTKSADGPLGRARANYWLGRTHEALGDQVKARESYQAAAAFADTFHGQLARLKLDPQATAMKIAPPATPTPEEIARFNSLDAVHAAVLAHKADLDRTLVRAFLGQLRLHLNSEAELAMLAHLAEALGDTQMAIRIAKSGVGRGMNLIYYAYPVHRMPAYTPLRQPVETAVILGLARQESEFNTAAVSGAGARGILQVMPMTARHICRDYKLKCDIPRLMKDSAYNMMLGSAYVADRMEEFSGSYVLALASYNAGPGRAREWISEFGDPRSGKIDPIDWIHRIPIEETREYVQKVLSNIQVYRARLGDEANAVRLNTDLKRASVAPASKAAEK